EADPWYQEYLDQMADREAAEVREALEEEERRYRQAEREGKRMDLTPVPLAPKSRQALKKRVQELFSVPDGSKAQVNELVDVIADELQLSREISEERWERLFEALYDAGAVTQEADSAFRVFRDSVRGTKIYVNDSVKAEFGDDWNDFRRRAQRAGITPMNSAFIVSSLSASPSAFGGRTYWPSPAEGGGNELFMQNLVAYKGDMPAVPGPAVDVDAALSAEK
ncbi:MAG: hypothetical protein IJ705_06215, partial [Oscillospiraceae bacterium]|nr:hypothetical protein [Oscillospiraceae bacterium]